jgi:hypothetical protein
LCPLRGTWASVHCKKQTNFYYLLNSNHKNVTPLLFMLWSLFLCLPPWGRMLIAVCINKLSVGEHAVDVHHRMCCKTTCHIPATSGRQEENWEGFSLRWHLEKLPGSFINLENSSKPRSYRLWGPQQPPIQWIWGALALGVKRPGREAGHSPLSSAEIKNAWSYKSTRPIRHDVVLS